ncbi:LysM peptidoglycan-binding domain-containing M23 family metallopeptidase [Azospirillum thermophilum]|uniref:Gamma-D-glutamyl-meso-diaminopimelate peptidase n=1 Tax=Azospirillum thermophilum TaxID=2202148 RepID=A0A2S2CKT6_9PROT|nr:LysM peptidoglycan-binding domain-containing M23 family metallopeptidase [Azospirillum thermophilum]AWK85135.1 gamma-D-glutamyl-meso-diaminopimelate peptidase [Azospirillum thermophilum]
MVKTLLVSATLALALAACERTGGLAPVTSVSSLPESAGGSVTVQKGDSAYLIAKRYNVPLRDLIDANRLSPPYKLEVGQRLTLPTSRQYVVQKGDTLYGISRMHNVDVSELTRINNLTPPYAVQAGQTLRLPGEGRGAGTAVAEGGEGAGAPVPLTPPAGGTASRGSVQATELPPPGSSSAGGASSVSGVTATPLPPPKPGSGAPATADAQQPGEPGTAYQPGQAPTYLRPPGSKPADQAPQTAPPAVAQAPVPVPSPPPANRNAPSQPQQDVAAAEPPKADAAPPPRGGKRFLWPVKGKLISGYGPKPDGMHNDGLNIAASKGAAVVAADNGVVAYAGNELRGFGNLLLIKHADGWITAYAHLDRIEVERGASVKRGQLVGRVGQTGSVTSPQLHFELRKGSQAVDPGDQMEPKPSEGASRDDRPGPG